MSKADENYEKIEYHPKDHIPLETDITNTTGKTIEYTAREGDVVKIEMVSPLFNCNELECFQHELDTNLDSIVHEIGKKMSKDRDIIILKKVIEKQQKEIEELKKKCNSKYYHTIKCRELEKEINNNWKDKINKLKEEVETEQISNPYDFSYLLNEILEEK